MSEKTLAASCPGCGHTANYHPTLEQHRIYWASTGGRYALECKHFNGPGQPCCRCIASREEVAGVCQ